MENRQYLQSIYDQVRDLGAANSQYEFSALCGRKPKWFSSKKSVNGEITVDAMVALAFSVDRLSKTNIHESKRSEAEEFLTKLWSEIKERSKALNL